MPQKSTDGAEQFRSIGVVHFCASVHIFVYQLYSQHLGYFAYRAFQHWAPCWYSFFLTVEGFKLTYTQLTGSSPGTLEPLLPFVGRQLLRLLPVHLVSLALIGLVDGKPNWSVLPANVLPIFTWIGTEAGGWHKGWNGGSWVQSDLLFHVLCWRYAYRWVASLDLRSCWCLLGAGVSLTFLRIIVLALGIVRTDAPVMWAPYTFNQFLCGMCLARLRHGAPKDPLELEIWPSRYPFSGVLAASAVPLIIHFGPYALSLQGVLPLGIWTGLLLPVHLLVIWGLSYEEGPFARLCSWGPIAWLGDAAYAMYVLHYNTVLAVVVWGSDFGGVPFTGQQKFLYILLPSTVLLVALVHFLVDRPVQALSRQLFPMHVASKAE